MTPGREMDALVAERVMGAKVWSDASAFLAHVAEVGIGSYPSVVVGIGSYPSVDWNILWRFPVVESEHGRLALVPAYSTDIAAAWSVVEKLGMLLFTVEREQCSGVRYDASCYMDPSTEPKFRGHGSTAPEAICRAALAAVGWEEAIPS